MQAFYAVILFSIIAAYVLFVPSGSKKEVAVTAPSKDETPNEDRNSKKSAWSLTEEEEKARLEVNSFITAAESGNVEYAIDITDFYCGMHATIPVESFYLVYKEYKSSQNCANKAVPLLRRLANAGEIEAQLKLADLMNSNSYLRQVRSYENLPPPDDQEAFRWYLEAATKAPDQASAAMSVADCYEHGIGTERNLATAFHWYQKSARLGSTASIKTVAKMLIQGQGVPKNPKESIGWLSKLPNDDEDGQFKLAEAYLLYDPENADSYEKARRIFSALHIKSSLRDTKHEAAYYLGIIYSTVDEKNGKTGIKRDYKAAYDYFKEAAMYGESQAQYRLSMLYFRGIGAIQSYKDAYRWATIAAANGNEQAAQYRNEIQKYLSKDKIDEARTLASKWGSGSNSVKYLCDFSEDSAKIFERIYSIDFDTGTVSSKAFWSTLDVDVDDDEIAMHDEMNDSVIKINRHTNAYTISDKSATLRGSCTIISGNNG